MKLQFLQFLLFLYALSHRPVHADVFEKYITLKRSLSARTLLPARRPLPRARSARPDAAKAEHDMRAAMLAKPSKPSRPSDATRARSKYANGHTFIPSVPGNATRRAPNATRPSPAPQRRRGAGEQGVHRQQVVDAVVGQGARAGHRVMVEARVESAWFASKAARVVVVSLVVWACAIAARKTDARRKARVLKKRLTNPRMMA